MFGGSDVPGKVLVLPMIVSDQVLFVVSICCVSYRITLHSGLRFLERSDVFPVD